MNLSLEKIIINAGTQSRAKIDEQTVAEYADRMMDGDVFPPVIVFYNGKDYWLADGFHRFFAAKRCAAPNIKCEVIDGDLRDALLYSYKANVDHGLRRTADDKRKSVLGMLEDLEWQDWADREIARHCGVSQPFVSSMRKKSGLEKDTAKYNRLGKTFTKKVPTQEAKQDPAEEFNEAEVQREQMAASIEMLRKENEELQDQLTVVQSASIDDIQKEKAESVVRDLRAQIRALEIELKEVTISRDMYQRENGELKKQVSSLLKKLKKLEG